ncbi:MAG: CAP domain-containing protein [Patescibacteria group bacterium]|nr:CAP domain-containing protein [Patescibacteria group bacterium]
MFFYHHYCKDKKIPLIVAAILNSLIAISLFAFIDLSFVGRINASDISEQKIFELTNSQRASNGLSALSLNNQLYIAAKNKAKNMASLHYFDHYSPLGQSPWDFMIEANYNYKLAGENLAMDFRTSEGVVKGLMNSAPHKNNILNPEYENMAIAVEYGEIGNHQTTLVVQMFGKPDYTVLGKINNLFGRINWLILGK